MQRERSHGHRGALVGLAILLPTVLLAPARTEGQDGAASGSARGANSSVRGKSVAGVNGKKVAASPASLHPPSAGTQPRPRSAARRTTKVAQAPNGGNSSRTGSSGASGTGSSSGAGSRLIRLDFREVDW